MTQLVLPITVVRFSICAYWNVVDCSSLGSLRERPNGLANHAATGEVVPRLHVMSHGCCD